MALTVVSVAYPFAPVGPDAVGGAEQILYALDAALVAAGHRSIVIAAAGSRVAGELRAVPAAPSRIDETVRLSVHAHVNARLKEAQEKDAPDVAHLHGVDAHQTMPEPGQAALLTLHLPPDWYAADLVAAPPPGLRLVPVSRTQAALLPQGDHVLSPIENGVPLRALSRFSHARRNFALFLGRICPEKGVHHALDAAVRADVPLLVAGEAFGYAAHLRYVEEEVKPRLDGRRRWLGPLGFARKRRFLSAARCVLIPSTAPEPSSLVAREAAACGTPVIAFRSGALPETVEHGRTGFIVDDVASMVEAIARAGDIDGEECRRIARQRFSLERMTQAYLDLYARLATKGSSDGAPGS